MYFTAPPNGIAKLRFRAHFQAPGLPTDVCGAQDLLTNGGHHLVGPSVVREAHGYLQRRGCLRDSKLAGQEAVLSRAAAMLEAVAVFWSAAKRYATKVIWLVVKTSWSGPVR